MVYSNIKCVSGVEAERQCLLVLVQWVIVSFLPGGEVVGRFWTEYAAVNWAVDGTEFNM